MWYLPHQSEALDVDGSVKLGNTEVPARGLNLPGWANTQDQGHPLAHEEFFPSKG